MNTARPPIVIIGGTSGIGLATAKLSASRGAAVTIVGRDPAKLTAVLAEIRGGAHGVAAEAGDRAGLDDVFGWIAPIDHLVLAASGGGGAGAFKAVALELPRRGFETKFWVHWNAAHSVIAPVGPTRWRTPLRS